MQIIVITRLAEKLVRKLLKQFPAVGIIGARQSGKTTLAKLFSDVYFDLEQEGDQTKIDIMWSDLCERKGLIILDEAQNYPKIFQKLRGAIDAKRKSNGRFLVLGSVAPSLMKHVGESLAGRLGLVELHPLNVAEIKKPKIDNLWLYGGFPGGGILKAQDYPKWQTSYLNLLIQRDLPLWGIPAKPQVLSKLLKMLAAIQGQQWNASEIGSSMGLSYNTVNSYLNYLEGAFLIRRLDPYFKNLKKRLVKSPKVYWCDTGILHSILNVVDFEDLISRPWVGSSWEGFVIMQILSYLKQTGFFFDAYYFRTNDGHEIDLVLDFGKELWAIEIKIYGEPRQEDIARLQKTSALIDASKQILICRTQKPIIAQDSICIGLYDFLNREFLHSLL